MRRGCFVWEARQVFLDCLAGAWICRFWLARLFQVAGIAFGCVEMQTFDEAFSGVRVIFVVVAVVNLVQTLCELV